MNIKKVFLTPILLIIAMGLGVILFHKPSKKTDIPLSPAPAKQENKQVYVVQVSEVVTDSLSLHLRPERDAFPSDAFALDEEKSDIIKISPLIKQAIEKKESAPSLIIDDKINAIEDVGVIVIEKIKFSGQGRYGDYQKIYLSTSLPPLYFIEASSSIRIKIKESLLNLFTVIPGPREFQWEITDKDKLFINTGEERYTLFPGEEISLPAQKVEIPVTVETLAPLPKGDIPPDEFGKIEEMDFGMVSFKTIITIKYYGKLSIEE